MKKISCNRKGKQNTKGNGNHEEQRKDREDCFRSQHNKLGVPDRERINRGLTENRISPADERLQVY